MNGKVQNIVTNNILYKNITTFTTNWACLTVDSS